MAFFLDNLNAFSKITGFISIMMLSFEDYKLRVIVQKAPVISSEARDLIRQIPIY
jgi:hypothetical protein